MRHWLPDHQLGVAATLSHADELVGQVADVLFAYQARPNGTFELEEQLAFPNTRTVVTHVAPMPRKVPLLVVDALVALRAALEHALFAEVEFRDGKLDEKAARAVEIPAARTAEDFESWATGRVKNGPTSLHPGSDLVQRIEALQPFNRKDAENHPLARLVLHTNHAKHRTPAVTAVRIAAMYTEDQMPRSGRSLPPRPEVPLRVGDVIAETPYGTRVPVTLFPTIGINRPGTDRRPATTSPSGTSTNGARFRGDRPCQQPTVTSSAWVRRRRALTWSTRSTRWTAHRVPNGSRRGWTI